MSVDPGAEVHATAIVEDGATIGDGCRIGAYCTVAADVVLEAGVVLHSHVAVAGKTSIGEGTVIFPFASIGHAPQDLKYAGEPTELIVGRRNRIRVGATLNPGTVGGGGVTRIGDDNLLMVGTHIAHDCIVGNRVIFANNATLGGHVVVSDNVVIGGMSAVHQFTRLGEGCMVGGMTGVQGDVIPFGTVIGNRCQLVALNLTGLKRRGHPREQINGLRAAFDAMRTAPGTFAERIDAATAVSPDNPLVGAIARFVSEGASRSYAPFPA